MTLHELSEEFALTDLAAGDLCTQLGIVVSSAQDRLSEADAARFRAAAHAELVQGLAADPPPSTPAAPFAAPGSPRAAPGDTPPVASPADDLSVGWAAPEPSGPWSPGTNGHRGDAGPVGPGPGSTAPAGGGEPSWARSADLARLDAARVRARSYTNQGYALLALGLVITLGTLALAPGGFFIVSFGTVFMGFRRLRVGRMLNAQIRQAEDQLGSG